ncbi:MAG: hypothetical protein ACTSSN_13690, partial [Candidatus Heimdallarchaeaceae archaeon]
DHKMKIYDISDPENPIPAGIYNLPQVGHDVFVAGDYAYVVASSAGVLSLRIADTGGHFGGLYGHYAEALSNIIYFAPAGETLERAFLYPTRTIDPDTSIVYYLSADGGAHWESVSPGVEHYFVNTGQMLKWKADLSTTLGTTTPILYNVSVVYYTEDVGIDLLYPGDGTYIQVQTPNFDWNDVPGVMGYQLQVAESTSFHTLLVNESLIMHESNYTLTTPLDYFGQYYWRVAFYIDSNTLSVFSAYSTFTIDDEPVVNEFGKLNTILILVSCLAISSAIIFYKRRKA